MKITQNTTDIPTEELREMIQLARPPGISNFTIAFENKHNFTFLSKAYYRRNHVKIGVNSGNLFAVPYRVEARDGGYLGCLLLDRREVFVLNIAHELRHLWQMTHKRGQVWGARGRFSDRDADAWAIRKVREYRRLHHPKDRIDLLAFLFPMSAEPVRKPYIESKPRPVLVVAADRSPKPKMPESYKIQKTVTFFHCLRCGKEWLPRFPDKEPSVCKFCKNPYWNKPRKAATK